MTNLRPLPSGIACAALLLFAVLLAGCSDDTAGPEAGPDPVVPPEGYVTIPAGSYMMGSPENEPGRGETEHLHPVEISRPFYMKAHEVTNREYMEAAQWALDQGLIRVTWAVASTTGDTIYVLRDVGGGQDFFLSLSAGGSEIEYDRQTGRLFLYDVGFGINPDHPVKYITWWGAAAYCNWLSLQEGLTPAYDQDDWTIDLATAEGYRLPTEAEWEYAARGGRKTSFGGSHIQAIGCDADSLQYQGWYCFNATEWTMPVAQLAPNAYGLYDMHGNVWEMCNDWYAEEYYKLSPDLDPSGPPSGTFLRSSRGGSWTWGAKYARSAQRGAHFLGMVSEQEGMRPVRTVAR